MGVIPCDRVGCDNIMCSRYSYRHNSRLCNDCFEELVELGPGAEIDVFLCTVPRSKLYDKAASRDYWDSVFPEI